MLRLRPASGMMAGCWGGDVELDVRGPVFRAVETSAVRACPIFLEVLNRWYDAVHAGGMMA